MSNKQVVWTMDIAESLNVGGAELNVHKLLGVHEQGALTDVSGMGSAISNGDLTGYPASNAFDAYVTEWRSIQQGTDILKEAFIGYDFGPFILDNGRVQYGIETYFKRNISMIRIKQGCWIYQTVMGWLTSTLTHRCLPEGGEYVLYSSMVVHQIIGQCKHWK